MTVPIPNPTYVTPTDVRGVLDSDGNLAQQTAASMNDGQIQTQINYAHSQVDAALRGTYVVPLSPVPEIIVNICADIAAYLCDTGFRKNKPYTSAQQPILLRYARAMLLLTQIANGTYIIDANPLQIVDSGAGVALNRYNGSMFSLQDFNLGFGPTVSPFTNPSPGIN